MSEPSSSDAPAPETFYASTHRYRNAKSVVLLVVIPLFAVMPIYIMVRGIPPGRYFTSQWFVATIVALGFIAGLVKLISNLVNNVQHPVRIDTAGVLLPSGRFLPWGEVSALRFDRGPFARRGYLACATTAEPTLFRSLFGERTLSPEEATRELERIGRFLLTAHPHVKVGLPQRPRSSDA